MACVSFQYGITNDAGVGAQAIFDQDGNTLKIGLIAATQQAAAHALDTALPESGRKLEHQSTLVDSGRFTNSDTPIQEAPVLRVALEIGRQRLDESEYQTRERRVPSKSRTFRRRLAFLSDAWPPTIDAVVGNPFCEPVTDLRECAIVASTVCVLLEEGDDREMVREAVLRGIEEFIASGEFEDSIPPEHALDA